MIEKVPPFPKPETGIDLPEPDCEFGYSFAQLRGLLGDDAFTRLEGSDLHRTVTICEGEACAEAHGRVAFVRDVRDFVH